VGKRKHLIIGCGTGGLTAAEEIRRINGEDEIKIVTSEDYPPYSPTVLPYLLSGKIDEAHLPLKRENYFDVLKATLVRGMEITGIMPEYALLIATGAKPSRPPIKGLDESGYNEFHTIEDCKKLLGQLSGNTQVAVLGSGLVGMEVAIGLAERGCSVTIIEQEQRPLPLYFDDEAGSLIASVFLNHGVHLLTGKEVVEVSEGKGTLAISFSDGHAVDAKLLVTCTGVKPRIDFLQGSGISVSHGILVDRRMMTNIKDIYAAGDVAEAPDFFTGRSGMNQIIESAVDEGRIAGSNMAGVDDEYEGWISSNIFHFFGHTAFSAGLSMPDDNGYQVLSKKEDKETQFKKLVFDGNKLVGAMFIDVELDPGLILYLIRNRVDLSRHKEMLIEQPKEVGRWLMTETEHRGSASIQG
jgi:phenylglyoxylate dehydrogenase epsilon subunit